MNQPRAPLLIPLIGYLLQLYGFGWDVVWHLSHLRESFWTIPHFVVYLGVALVFASSLFAVLPAGAQAPIGAQVLLAASSAQILMAPVDDLWHRLYGIDNTLWSPPHLVYMLSGACSVLGMVLSLPSSGQQPQAARGEGLLAPLVSALKSGLPLSWSPLGLLRDQRLLLLGLFLSALDVTLLEFELNLPAPFWPWDFALYPPLIAAAALLAGFAGLALTRKAGALTAVCLTFTIVELGINLELICLHQLPLPHVPLLLPAAVAADLILASLRSPPAAARFGLVSLVFGALFYATQFPYTALFPLPDVLSYPFAWLLEGRVAARPWTLGMVSRSWPLAVPLLLAGSAAGLALGGAMRAASSPQAHRPVRASTLSPDQREETPAVART